MKTDNCINSRRACTVKKKLGQTYFRFSLFAALLLGSVSARAQLVADGQTNVVDGISLTFPGDVVVSSNGGYTQLVLTNGAAIINSNGNAAIGLNPSAKTNRVILDGVGSTWTGADFFYVGKTGSYNELDILDGASVSCTLGYIGYNPSSSNNLVLISGSGSLWSNINAVSIGAGGAVNSLVVSNGGHIYAGSGPAYLGDYVTSGSNSVVITGTNSSWTGGNGFSTTYRTVGNNFLTVNNGGSFNLATGTLDIGDFGGTNYVTVTDPGSLIQCPIFQLGNSGGSNQCVISNGATFQVTSSSQSTWVSGSNNLAVVTGAGSVWTNAGDLVFGDTSDRLAVLAGGTLVDNNAAITNGLSGAPNYVTVAGTNSVWRNAGLLSLRRNAMLFLTNGATLIDQSVYCGDAAGDTNTFCLVTDPGTVWTNQNGFYLGNNSAGNQMVISNSATVYAHSFYLGNNPSSVSNRLVVDGGSLIVSNSGSGSLIGFRGTVMFNSGLIQCDNLGFNNGAASALIFNGGTLKPGSSGLVNGVPFVAGDGTRSATLQLNGSGGLHTFSGGLVVTNHGTLTGFGTIKNDVTICSGGTFAPGNSNILSMSINGGLTLNPGSTTFCGLNAFTGAANNVAGLTNVIYGGTLQLSNVFAPAGYAPGSAFKLFSASNYSGAFAALVPAIPRIHLRWDTNELNVDGVLRIFSTNTPPPRFSGSALAQGNLMVNAANGIPYDACYLLTSTNIGAAQINWTCIATNYFDANGLTSFTNTISNGESQRYFRLQVN